MKGGFSSRSSTKKTKNLLSVFLCSVMLLLVLLPNAALAAPISYDLWVNGEQFTSENLTISCGEGVATYDPGTNSLTLTNATILAPHPSGYGIRNEMSSKLVINLAGSNKITITDDGGILSAGAVEFKGSGNLEIAVGGETYDGISAVGDLTIQDTAVTINAARGIGLSSDGTVLISGAVVRSKGLYAGIDAAALTIKNHSTVNLSATEDNCNAAFIDENGTSGSICISDSYVEAISFYPALFARGEMIIDGGTVIGTSTADAAIWSAGDLTVKGNAVLSLKSPYPAGCSGDFWVEVVDITSATDTAAFQPTPVIQNGLIVSASGGDTAQDAIALNWNEVDLADYAYVHLKTMVPATILVNKVDGYNQPLEGATFTLSARSTTTDAGDGMEVKYTAVSDENGVATLSNVTDGFYTLMESNAPYGYAKSDQRYSLYVQNGEVTLYTEQMPNGIPYAPLTFVNELEAFGEDAEVILEIPFTKIVEQTGKKVPGQQTFEFYVYGFGVSGAEDKVKLTANTIETNGKGNFEGTLELTLKESDLYEHGLLSEGFFVREKNGSADGWTYSDQVWYAMPNDNMGTWMFFNVVDGEPQYEEEPQETMSFTNSYNSNASSIPNTGDSANTEIWRTLLFASSLGIFVFLMVSAYKRNHAE